jgi:hypothetical protein
MEVKVGGEGAIVVGVFAVGVTDDELLAGDGGVLEGKLRHAALAGLSDLGEDVADTDGMEAAEDGCGHHFGVVGGGIDEGETAVFAEVGTGKAGDVGHREGVLVTGEGAAFVSGF